MKLSLAKAVLPLLAGAALTGVMAPSAHADSTTGIEPLSLSQCPSGNVCMWIDWDFHGAPEPYGAPTSAILKSGDHDRVSSWANFTSFHYCLYDNGTSVLLDHLSPGGNRQLLGPNSNDRADTFKRC